MRSYLIASVTETLTKKPEYGLVSSMLSISMSTTELMQIAGVIIGLFIAVITAILKVLELKEKLKARRKAKRLKSELLKSCEDDDEDEEDKGPKDRGNDLPEFMD